VTGDRTDWATYLADYHQGHPGITEVALGHARHPVHGTAHHWLAAIVPRPAGDVLDLACGSAPIQDHIDSMSYLGLDTSPAELDAARAAGRGPVRPGDATDLDVPDASVDTVVMSMALMLVPLERTLAEVARVLRPGGTFVAMVPATRPVRARDLSSVAMLSVALRGPGSMPTQLHAGALARDLMTAGLRPRHLARERFPFPIRTPDDARLAVQSLYTPGRTPAQLHRAEALLQRLPGRAELPVPLLRFTATRDDVANPGTA